MSDFLIAFQMALLSGGESAIKFKTEKEAKIAFPEIVKELEDYVNSNDYLMRIVKEMKEKTNNNKY
jgi:hypothetical protein